MFWGGMRANFYSTKGFGDDYNRHAVIRFITPFLPEELPDCSEGLDVQESVSQTAGRRPFCASIKRIPGLGQYVDNCAHEESALRAR